MFTSQTLGEDVLHFDERLDRWSSMLWAGRLNPTIKTMVIKGFQVFYIYYYIYIYVLIAGEQQEHYWADPLGRYEMLSQFPSLPRHREMMRAHFQRRDDDTNTNKKGSNLPRSFIAEKNFPKKSQGEFAHWSLRLVIQLGLLWKNQLLDVFR